MKIDYIYFNDTMKGVKKMQFIIVISMIFAIFIALFALQNAAIITINFLWYKLQLSQAVVILGSALIGILVMIPFDVVKRIKHGMKISELNNQIKKLNEELNSLKKEVKLPDIDDLTKKVEVSNKANNKEQ